MIDTVSSELELDSDIATVRSQIEALRHRRSLLSHAILSSREFNEQLERTRKESTLPRQALDVISEHAQKHANLTITNLHRTCSGITAFRVQDPDPNAVDEGNVLGIRFDVFSAQKRAFQTPYYLLLNQPKSGSDRLKIHKHTIPPFITLSPLIAKYLPQESDDVITPTKASAQNLPRLVRALRRELVAHHKRIEACEKLKRELEDGRHGIKHVKQSDATGREIEILFPGNALARLRVAKDGKIERTVVGSFKATDDKDISEEGQEPHGQIKRRVEGGNCRIDSLADRLK